MCARETIRAAHQDLHEQEFVECKTVASLQCFRDRCRTVDHSQRVAEGGKLRRAKQSRGEILVYERQQNVEVRLDDPANDLERESFSRRINRKNPALVSPVLSLPRLTNSRG